jgi:hypothetical protein
MIDFRVLILDDISWLKPLLRSAGERGAEYSFTNSLVWGGFYNQRIACVDGFAVIKAGIDQPHYNFPCGHGDVKQVIEKLTDDAKAGGYPFRMRALSHSTREKLENLFPGRFDYREMRDLADYIYAVEDLISLSGRAYQPKRNLISRFQKNNEWEYEPVTSMNVNDCVKMNREWCRRNNCNDNGSLNMETEAVMTMLANFEKLGLAGGLLRVKGEVVAYTVGEPLSDDTFIVHIEKAFTEFQGAYQMINQQFLIHDVKGFTYVNREDDAGDEGLRKAKMSYHPVFLQEKFIAIDKIC